MTANNGIVVFSGGSAANNLVDVFANVAEEKKCILSYIIPISDNGGSSSELIRVFGGPGIGDIRSRLVRLIPSTQDPEKKAIKTFFNHRLSSISHLAKSEWTEIVEGSSPLWRDISSAKRELIRSFLTTLNLEIIKRVRPSSTFNFQSASVGNLFLTGARLFTGSFEAAIYLLGSITGVPENVKVIPAINSNFSHHICAVLEDGTSIPGQNSISHPTERTTERNNSYNSGNNDTSSTNPPQSPTKPPSLRHTRLPSLDPDAIEDANLPGSLATLRLPSLTYSKAHTTALPSPISRIHYISNYGQEIRPAPNTAVSTALNTAETVIYSIGSLYTSIIPCLVLRDVGGLIRKRENLKFKILILNGSLDRETGLGVTNKEGAYDAVRFVRALVGACWESEVSSSVKDSTTSTSSSKGMGIGKEATMIISEDEFARYITHVIHLTGSGTPFVDTKRLGEMGIACVRVYGRRVGSDGDDGEGGMVYDAKALEQALEAIIGKSKGGSKRDGNLDRGRRNTLIS